MPDYKTPSSTPTQIKVPGAPEKDSNSPILYSIPGPFTLHKQAEDLTQDEARDARAFARNARASAREEGRIGNTSRKLSYT